MLEGTISRLQLVDPTTHPVIPEFSGAPRVNDMANARVGIIDDSKVNAKEYLHELISLLNERYGVSNVEYHAKPSASRPVDPDVIKKMAKGCDYIIAGIGD